MDGLTLMEIHSRLGDIFMAFPELSYTQDIRFYGGQGPVLSVQVERNDRTGRHEIVFNTRSW